MAQYVYSMLRVGKIVPPKRQILKDISLSFFPGAKIGVLGLNGSGKSTLIKIMAGVDKDIEGEAVPQPKLKIGYLPQEPQLDPAKTVREEVEAGLGEVMEAKKKLDEIYAAYAEPDADFDKLAEEQARLEAILATSGADAETQLEIAADALRLPPWDARIAPLSGGEKRRVALCKLLLSRPDMLLLDEPTNHLDAESVEWLEQFLVRFPGTVVAVTHDRYFLDNAAEWILELDRGHGIPWKGNYSSWLEQKETRLKQEESSESARQKALAKELEWVRQNPKGRQAKAKARIARFEELNSVEYQKRNETQEIFIPPGERLGDKVIEFHHVSKAFGDRLLIDDLSFAVPPGAIVGVIGPNGAGKSTLFRMIMGREQPDSTRPVKAWTIPRPCSKCCPAEPTFSPSAALKCPRAPISAVSISRAPISRRISAACPAASAAGCTWPRRSSPGPMCCCSTNPQMIWTWKPCARWKTRCWNSPAVCSSPRTTAGSSTGSRPTSWQRKAIRIGNSSPATIRNTKPTRRSAWARKGRSPTAFATSRFRASSPCCQQRQHQIIQPSSIQLSGNLVAYDAVPVDDE
jgi:sulfate-transporting ATPase